MLMLKLLTNRPIKPNRLSGWNYQALTGQSSVDADAGYFVSGTGETSKLLVQLEPIKQIPVKLLVMMHKLVIIHQAQLHSTEL